MYKQPSHTYSSTDSLRRLSSNNPFRSQVELDYQQPLVQEPNNSPPRPMYSPSRLSNVSQSASFDSWVRKNKQLVDVSSDEEDDGSEYRSQNNGYKTVSHAITGPPKFPPRATRADSDTSIQYSARYVFFYCSN